MQNKIDELCLKMLENIRTESNIITKQIKNFYVKNKDNENVKQLTEDTFQEQIRDFKSKYLNFSAGIIIQSEGKDVVIGLDARCSEKLKTIVNEFVNYIDSLE